MTKAIGLFSGGLDSMLAARLLQEQGIEVTALTFTSPFFGAKRAKKGAKQLGVELVIADISEPHFEVVRNPAHGYGRNMNPCIDCHALMIRFAGREMEKRGLDFIFTGEVLGQRPFSQNRKALDVVARESGYGESLLRPLCARLLKPTQMELEGLVDRERLLDIQGRSRRRQLELARQWGLTEYSSPAGGCKLTDPGFSHRLREALADDPGMDVRDVEILKVGRHFRLGRGVRLVVGKNRADNERIEALAREGDVLLRVVGHPGPLGCLRSREAEPPLETAAAVTARYSDAPRDEPCRVEWREVGRERRGELLVTPFGEEEARAFAILPGKR